MNGTFVDVACAVIAGPIDPLSGTTTPVNTMTLKVYAVSNDGRLWQTLRNGIDNGWTHTSKNINLLVTDLGTVERVSACLRRQRGTHVVITNSNGAGRVLNEVNDDSWIPVSTDLGAAHSTSSNDFIDVSVTDWGAGKLGFYGIKCTNDLLEGLSTKG